MQEQDPHSELRQEEIQEILGVVPPWILRWGILTLFFVFIALLAGAVWFKYPDRIYSQITVTTSNPPVLMNARKDGRIQALLVKDNEEVKAGQLLAVLESSADYNEMLSLESEIARYRNEVQFLDSVGRLDFPKGEYQLGEWQAAFARFQKAHQDLMDFLAQGVYQARVKALKKQLADYRLLYERQNRQRLIRSEEMALEEKQYQRVQGLFETGAIAAAEMESAKTRYLKSSYDMETARTVLAQTQIQIDQIDHQIIDNEKEYHEVKAQKINGLNETIELVAGIVADWKLNYTFISPVEGVISLTRFWSTNQFIKAGERVMTVITGNPGPVLGKVLLPLRGAGKVNPGQKVLVRLDKYPYMEFGMVVGRVEGISQVADQDFYSVEISFSDGLVTSYKKTLELSQGMTGQAEIITQEMSFLVRVINPLKNLIYRNRV